VSLARSITGSEGARADDAQAPPSAVAMSSSHAARRHNNFDALRLLAACLVVYGHQTVDRTGTVGLRLVMFFAIGGFLVGGSWISDPHLGRFLARRFLRVWPAYAVLIVSCAALSWIFPAPDMPEISRIASGFYLTNLWAGGFDWGFFLTPQRMMNKSIWMFPYEVDLYLAFAVIALCGRRARIVVSAIVLAIAMPATQTTSATGGILECWSPYFGGFFAFGVLLREWPLLRDSRVVAACVATGVLLLALGARTAGLLMVIPPAAVWIGLRSWPVLRSASRFGDLSYGIFLWAFPVQQVTRLWLASSVPVAVQLAVVFLQLVPIAWLSWHLVEAPALRRKPRVGAARGVSQDASRRSGRTFLPALAAFGSTVRGAPSRAAEWLAGVIPTPFR
jgi:peptidoglycan/LPS O-acetylase OafA/YrhL